ncbi:cytochrome c biogenesis CcdA family protein [Sphingobium naphthae]|jgi:cytochrome c biogenesis protein CcdA|uniref:Cytochrome c biogenesis CcdA family protein n=1 Tax=Sphingobium naphthae TaxID=1886786 RepID=A0ABU4A1U2_9SPHN|nr:cytochrome c biogenesis CcdA family protein [Sphingobium naphthae]MDV5825702.1 cytochrome c biogenesis CcdA family protein [Sphingobium naphthae]
MASALNPALAYVAGALTILSPCVLPLVPIVLSSAAQRHRFAPVALAAGLVLAFTATGFVVAAFGQALGIDTLVVRNAGAIILCLAGIVLLIPRLQDGLSRIATPAAAWASRQQSALDDRAGLWGQALVGALLGIVWAPCVGPTLGAAVALAAEGKDLGEVALVMAAFGLGISTVLLVIAFVARGALARWRGRMMAAGGHGKIVLGGLLLIVGIFILTGVDRQLEAFALDHLPDRVTEWSTAF